MPARTKVPSPTDAELAWLAGLLEGEGSFWLYECGSGSGKGTKYRYPRIAVNMTDRDVIERVAALFGTKMYTTPPAKKYPARKQQWKAFITGTSAALWMRLLYPYMGERRRAKIDEVLAKYEAIAPEDERRRIACQEAAAGRERAAGRFVKAG